jgi:hypothetical protein
MFLPTSSPMLEAAATSTPFSGNIGSWWSIFYLLLFLLRAGCRGVAAGLRTQSGCALSQHDRILDVELTGIDSADAAQPGEEVFNPCVI